MSASDRASGCKSDAEAIHLACLDYVEGFLASDAARVEMGVHPALVKRTVRGGDLVTMDRQTSATSRPR